MAIYQVHNNLKGIRFSDGSHIEDALQLAVSVMESSVFGEAVHEHAVYFVQNVSAGPGRRDLAEKHWANLREGRLSHES